jgi:hypothetical protein
MIYNKNVEQLITERHAFVPLEFDLTPSPMPVAVGGDTDAPSFAPTPAPTAVPSASPVAEGSPTLAPVTSIPTSAPVLVGEPVEVFLTLTVTDDGALQEMGTPQNLALQDILTNFPDLDPTNGEADQILILEIYALNTLFYATNGGNWVDRTAWTGPALPCDAASTWFGLTCDASGRVLQIDLTSNDLMGQLPSEIRVLPQLGTIYTCDWFVAFCVFLHATH